MGVDVGQAFVGSDSALGSPGSGALRAVLTKGILAALPAPILYNAMDVSYGILRMMHGILTGKAMEV